MSSRINFTNKDHIFLIIHLPAFSCPVVLEICGLKMRHDTQINAISNEEIHLSLQTMSACEDIPGRRSGLHRHFAATEDPNVSTVAMQQLSIQQAFSLKSVQPARTSNFVLEHSGPETAEALARAKTQLEAAAATLVAAATAPPNMHQQAFSPSGSISQLSDNVAYQHATFQHDGMDSQAVPFTARNHNKLVCAKQERLQSSSASHALGPLGAGELRLQQQPSRFLQLSPGYSAPMTARAAQQSDVVDLASWDAMPLEDLERCQKLFIEKVLLYGCFFLQLV